MASRLPMIEPDKLQPRYYDALIASGLIDDIQDIMSDVSTCRRDLGV